MDRGFFKFYRKAQDSASWNRGLMYQGLMINFLNRALWKKGSYQGRDLRPGQFGTVISQLAESLGVARSTLQRMVAHLEADDFLTAENVGKRYTIITIKNWHLYQSVERDGGQPAGNPRLTSGQPAGDPLIRKEEGKKEEDQIPPLIPEDEDRARDPELQEVCVEEEYSAYPPPDQAPVIEFQELRLYYDEHARPEAPLAGWDEYKQARAAKVWPGHGAVYDAIDNHARGDPQWQRGFAPGLARFIRERWWMKKVCTERVVSGKPSPGQDTLGKNTATAREVLAERQARRNRNAGK